MTRLLRRLAACLLVMALVVASTGLAVAQGSVTVRLDPAGGSNVSGTATLTAEGQGTRVNLEVTGLAAGTDARTTLHAGTCATPGASAAALPALTAGANGQATASGMILFRGTENVALADIADGAHIIAVAGPDGTVACGQVPSLGGAAGGSRLPATGAATPGLLAALLAGAGLLAAGGGLWLRRRQDAA